MSEQTGNPTEEAQAGAESTPAAAGEEAVTDTLTLSELNELTGKNFKDKDTALKSIKDMTSQAGKVSDLEGKLKDLQKQAQDKSSEQSPQSNDDALKELRAEIEQTKIEAFFARNPEHESNRALLERIAKADGLTIQEAIETDVYKTVLENTKAAEETRSKRTVAESKNRTQSQSGRDKDFEKTKDSGEWGKFLVKHHLEQSNQ